MFDKLQFYHGSFEDYDILKDNGKITNCFYYIYNEEKTHFKLYLNQQLIYDSQGIANMAAEIIETDNFKEKFAKYVLLDPDNKEQIIKGDLKANSIVTTNLKVEKNIDAENFKFENDMIAIPYPTVLGEGSELSNSTFTGGFITNAEISKSPLKTITELSFDDNASLENLPTYNNGENISFNFKDGVLKVSKIEAQTIIGQEIFVDQDKVSTETNTNTVFTSLQIGNLILSDDGNGNLKITSIYKNEQ